MRSARLSADRGAVGTERIAAWVLVLLAIALALAVLSGTVGGFAATAPDATFEGSYDGETGTVTLTHAGTDPIEAGPTDALVVVVEDADGEHGANVTWAGGDDGVAALPIRSGDSISIDDSTTDADGDGNRFDADATVGFALDAGDEARVVWTGRPFGAPGTQTETLGSYEMPSA